MNTYEYPNYLNFNIYDHNDNITLIIQRLDQLISHSTKVIEYCNL